MEYEKLKNELLTLGEDDIYHAHAGHLGPIIDGNEIDFILFLHLNDLHLEPDIYDIDFWIIFKGDTQWYKDLREKFWSENL